jgi:hypothetical protein
MQQDYKDISELKTEVAVVKERQRIIDERLSEIVESNKSISAELKKMHEENSNPKKEFVTIVVRSSAMVIASLMATIITMLIMFKK